MADIKIRIKMKDGDVFYIDPNYTDMEEAIVAAEKVMHRPESYLSLPSEEGKHLVFASSEIVSFVITDKDK